MPDYKELYLTMMRASEQAIRILIQAQQDCEERYLSEGPTVLEVCRKPEDKP